MKMFTVFVLTFLVGAQNFVLAQTPMTLPTQTTPTAPLVPVPDPISSGGIGNVTVCIGLQAQISELQRSIHLLNEIIAINGADSPVGLIAQGNWVVATTQLSMLQMAFAIQCGGGVITPLPQETTECEVARLELTAVYANYRAKNAAFNAADDELNEARAALTRAEAAGVAFESLQIWRAKFAAALAKSNAAGVAKAAAIKAIQNFEWPVQCGPQPGTEIAGF